MILSAVVLFVWGFISWAILPWHNAVANKFADESAVSAVLKENASSAGVYYLPFAQEDLKPGGVVRLRKRLARRRRYEYGRNDGTWPARSGGLRGACPSSSVQDVDLDYWGRIRFVALAGVAIGFVSHFPYWNWFGFSTSYTLVIILDSLIAWLLAGLVMAQIRGRGNPSRLLQPRISRLHDAKWYGERMGKLV